MNNLVSNNSTAKCSPFIIWTLQRTGGTNLAKQSVSRSDLMCNQHESVSMDYKPLDHEPFNMDRVYGHITRQWMASRDEGVLIEKMQEIVAQND